MFFFSSRDEPVMFVGAGRWRGNARAFLLSARDCYGIFMLMKRNDDRERAECYYGGLVMNIK